MNQKTSRPPRVAKFAELGPAGARVRAWLQNLDPEGYDLTEPLSRELCELADSLANIRAQLRKSKLTIMEQVRLRTLEHRLSESYRRTWRELGLSEEPIYGTDPEKV